MHVLGVQHEGSSLRLAPGRQGFFMTGLGLRENMAFMNETFECIAAWDYWYGAQGMANGGLLRCGRDR